MITVDSLSEIIQRHEDPDAAALAVLQMLADDPKPFARGHILAALRPGDTITMSIGNRTNLGFIRDAARKLVGSDAKWSSRSYLGVLYVTRQTDNWSRLGQRAGTAARTLADMAVGDSKIISQHIIAPGRDVLSGYRKRAARRLLNDPSADWMSRTTNHGVRVTRTA
mgnify:CR=1 FL=1